MKYPVTRKFRCKLTNKRYKSGDIYETADLDRAAFLIGKNVITESVQEREISEIEGGWHPQHIGGGWYELPDGTRVKGKAKALDALEKGCDPK